MEQQKLQCTDVDNHAKTVVEAFQIASNVLPTIAASAKRPWIGPWTMGLIETRNKCRIDNDYEGEMKLNTEIRKSAKYDRSTWINKQIENGTWQELKRFRKGTTRKHVGVRNLNGVIGSVAERAETLAEYFEKVQWQNRFPELVPSKVELLRHVLPISITKIENWEVKVALGKLKLGKAAGPDDIHPDFWKVLEDNASACEELTDLC